MPKVRAFNELSNIFNKIFKMKRVLGIGNALVDIMTLIDDDRLLERFSLPKGSMQLVDKGKSKIIKTETAEFRKTMTSGGSAANTIHGLAMLGAETGFIGSVGKDATGDIFENDMKQAGVNTMLLRHNSPTGTAIAMISSDSERTFATHLGAAVELEAEDLKTEYFRGYDIFYLEGYLVNNISLVDKACRIAKENKMEIALDLASYNVVDEYGAVFREIIDKYADIVFANGDEARSLTGLDPEEALGEIAGKCKIAIVKIGKEGSLVQQGNEIIRIESLPVSSKDTTGAGDLYASGFLYGYSNNLSLEKCGLLSSLLAGRVIETIGARIDAEKWPEIREIVSEITNK